MRMRDITSVRLSEELLRCALNTFASSFSTCL